MSSGVTLRRPPEPPAFGLRHNHKLDLAPSVDLCYNMAEKTHPFCKAVEGQAVSDRQPTLYLGVIPMVVGCLFSENLNSLTIPKVEHTAGEAQGADRTDVQSVRRPAGQR